jgi:hypothetical protein
MELVPPCPAPGGFGRAGAFCRCSYRRFSAASRQSPGRRFRPEETRAARSGMADGDPEILALLKATDEEGNPDWERRLKGAERYLESVEGDPSRGLLPGCVASRPRPSGSPGDA